MLPATAHKGLTRKDHSPRYSDYVVVMTLEAKGISPTQPWMPFESLYQSHEWHSGINGAPKGHLTLLTQRMLSLKLQQIGNVRKLTLGPQRTTIIRGP